MGSGGRGAIQVSGGIIGEIVRAWTSGSGGETTDARS